MSALPAVPADYDRLFHALADDSRRGMVDRLLRGPASVKELAEMMLELAATYPEYRASAKKVKLQKVSANQYYGRGYQDVQNRVPKITNTMADLDWKPRVTMKEALKRIFDAYRGDVAEARRLVD